MTDDAVAAAQAQLPLQATLAHDLQPHKLGIVAAIRLPMEIEDSELATVMGGGMWDKVDQGITKVNPNWANKSCSSRGNWIGWGVGTALGGATWATWPWLGPTGQAVLGPINGLIGTYAVSSYIDNCEQRKAGR